MREYALKLDKFGISRDAYMELKYFCRQYDQKRREAASLLGVGSPAFDASPKGNTVGRPTESAAIKRESLLADVDLIDRYQPQYLLHGHTHLRYEPMMPREHRSGETRIINVSERYELTVPGREVPRKQKDVLISKSRRREL